MSDCVLWTGPTNDSGYGVISNGQHGKPRRLRAHRVAYENNYGAIPAGHSIHHTCGNRACVKPEHLEAVPPGAHTRLHGNFLRASARAAELARANRADRCRNGHAYDEANTYWHGRSRYCRMCHAASERRRRAAREERAA